MNAFAARFAAVLMCLIANVGFASGLIVIDRPVPLPRPVPEPRRHWFAPLAVKQHHVRVRIDDQVAVTEIDQVFHNASHARLEGHFIFPIPRGAQLDRFMMDIDGKAVEAELLDADKARKIYEDIVRKVRDPALLEYAGQGMFKVRIFPIEPRSDKRVSLKYTQVLQKDTALTQYMYALNTQKFSSQPMKNLSVKCELRSKRNIGSVYSPSHDVEIKRHGSHHVVVGYEASDVRPDFDFQLFFAGDPNEEAAIGMDLLTFNKGTGEGSGPGFFLMLVSPGVDLDRTEIVHKNIVFVLDTSGSMQGEKLAQAKKALSFCIENLNEGDSFEIVRFSTEAEALFGRLVSTSAENRARADMFVNTLKSRGGTAINEALIRAGKTLTATGGVEPRAHLGFVIFLTDGRPTIGERGEDQIVTNLAKTLGESGVRVFCFGIGTDINTHLLDKITERTRATSQYVLPDEDLEIKVSNFYTKIDSPVLANPKLSLSAGIRASQTYPSPLPDLFQGDQLLLFGRYEGSGDSVIVLEGVVNGRTQKFTYGTAFAAKSGDHTFIPRLWATRRVGYLLDEIRLHGESEELKDEVARLARRYGIVTPYTAYLILEDEEQRAVPLAQRSIRGFDTDLAPEAAKFYMRSQVQRSGKVAIDRANAATRMKLASRLPGAAAPAYDTVLGRDLSHALREHARASCYIGGRTFYRHGDTWIGVLTQQTRTGAGRVSVTFASDEYFDLLTKHPDAMPWLALGRNVHVLLDDVIYEIND